MRWGYESTAKDVEETIAARTIAGIPYASRSRSAASSRAKRRHPRAASATAVMWLMWLIGHLKDGFFRGRDWGTFEELKADLEAYIRHWNHVRRQRRLKGLIPVEFREQALREAA